MSEKQNPLPFWEITPFDEMTSGEWESLCDGCARCCIQKLEDIDSGDLYYTQIVCDLLDLETCQCSQYPQRSKLVPTCITLTPKEIHKIDWMPNTCAYRLIRDKQPLPDWHPLMSKNSNSVIDAGISVKGKVIHESQVDEALWVDYITEKFLKE